MSLLIRVMESHFVKWRSYLRTWIVRFWDIGYFLNCYEFLANRHLKFFNQAQLQMKYNFSTDIATFFRMWHTPFYISLAPYSQDFVQYISSLKILQDVALTLWRMVGPSVTTISKSKRKEIVWVRTFAEWFIVVYLYVQLVLIQKRKNVIMSLSCVAIITHSSLRK